MELPINVQAKGFLAGFGALYAIFTTSCVMLFVSVLYFMRGGQEQRIFLLVFGGAFFFLIIWAFIWQTKNPNIFKTVWRFEGDYDIGGKGRGETKMSSDQMGTLSKIPPKS